MPQTPSGPGEAPPSDEALLEEYRRGESHRQESIADRLFSRYYERVGRWCYRLTGERESAADLAQEVFLKAHRHLSSFRGTSQFGTWLYSIARNEAINRFKRKALPPEESDEALIRVPSFDPDPEELATRRSSSRRLNEFLRTTLEETERTVFTLHYAEEVSLEAITRILRLENSSGAKAYIVSAKRKLARAVEKLYIRGESL